MGTAADYASLSDEVLISQIAASQTEALAVLYDRYSRLVFSLALAIVGDRPTAEEVTLDVFVRVWQKAGTFRAEMAQVKTWLTHIARNHAIDILRRRDARFEQDHLRWDDVPRHAMPTSDDTQELAELSLRRQQVRAALAGLPAEQRQALALAYFGGYTQRQIAEILGQPLGTIKSRMRSALERLREVLREEGTVRQSADGPGAYNTHGDE